jgi:hypothetical protein
MRLVGIFALTAVILMPGIGSFFWFKGELYVAKKLAKKELMRIAEDDELVTFKFSISDTLQPLDWVHSNEFRVNFEMYDIVRRDYSDDSVTYYTWHDNYESQVVNRMHRFMTQHLQSDPHHQHSKSSILLYFSHLYLIQETSNNHLSAQKLEQKAFFNYAENYLLNAVSTIDHPPQG